MLTKVEQWSWDSYTGTAEEILALGLVRADQFPGRSGGGPKYRVTDYRGVRFSKRGSAAPNDEYRTVVRRLSATRFELQVGIPVAEQELRRSRHDRAARLRKEISEAPKDEAEFRAGVAWIVQIQAQAMLRSLQPEGSTFRFSDAAVDAIRSGLKDCVAQLQYLDVVPDSAVRRRVEAELAALEDRPLQSFIAAVTAACER